MFFFHAHNRIESHQGGSQRLFFTSQSLDCDSTALQPFIWLWRACRCGWPYFTWCNIDASALALGNSTSLLTLTQLKHQTTVAPSKWGRVLYHQKTRAPASVHKKYDFANNHSVKLQKKRPNGRGATWPLSVSNPSGSFLEHARPWVAFMGQLMHPRGRYGVNGHKTFPVKWKGTNYREIWLSSCKHTHRSNFYCGKLVETSWQSGMLLHSMHGNT